MNQEFEVLLCKLYYAYYNARKNKRNTNNQLKFEINLETNLYNLASSIYDGSYELKPSIAFIVNNPVKREVFAADFADRVVHHLLYMALYPIIENTLIDDSYSCRKNKGTLYGINRVNTFIRSCSDNYQKDTYILKLDIKGYFMNMKHQVIYDKVINLLDRNKKYNGLNFVMIDFLLKKVIFNNVAKNCIIKGNKKEWVGLPKDKSLFYKKSGFGLAIGNLTSQIFGNLYLNDFDHFVKDDLNINYYGRYVDDMIFIDNDKNKLKNIISTVKNKVAIDFLEIHPKKIYLQRFDKGVLFIGQYIKPYRKYISNRSKNNFYKTLKKVDTMIFESECISWKKMLKIRSLLNSYLGLFKHADAYNLAKNGMYSLSKRFFNFFNFYPKSNKVAINKEFWQWHYLSICQYTN